jgi:hypothetical protein
LKKKSSITTRMAIPKQIYLFWNGPMPVVVERCIRRIRALHDKTWSVHLLTNASESVEGFEALSIQWKSDWVRVCAMQQGGIWLDASCICTKSVDSWVRMNSDDVQGFSAPFAFDSLENWAFAAPPHHPLLIRWKQILREAVIMGFDKFKSSVPEFIREHSIFEYMPYLTMHACYLMAAKETGRRAVLTPSCEGPFRYLCQMKWDTWRAVKALMHQPLNDPPPLIKLRGAETIAIGKIGCKDGSFMSALGMPLRNRLPILYMIAFVLVASFFLWRWCQRTKRRST